MVGNKKILYKMSGKKLRELREASGMSQLDLARRLGYSTPQYISNIERGICFFNIKNIPRVEKHLGVKNRELGETFLKAQALFLDSCYSTPVKKTKKN